ncbi:MAG: CRISPR-associated endoribonuclease Cas6 [bacterium]
MRIALRLLPKQKLTAISLNYQYSLSAAIYKILGKASPAYADFLHDHGYTAPSGRLMKIFTFSKLWNPYTRRDGRMLLSSKESWTLQVGSPMLEEFVQNFVLGLFETAEVAIGGPGWHAAFHVEQVEALPAPEFKKRMRFKCLSPITASTMIEKDGRLQVEYYRHDTPGLSEALRQNLLQKYQLVQGKPPENPKLTFRFEKSDRPKSKLITIKEGTPEETRRKAFESYFTLEGSEELMRIAWECGLGEENSMGFGMVEVVKSQR